MRIPDYIAADSLEDALRIKSRHGAEARVIAGGTDLILGMRNGAVSQPLLLDLHKIPLDAITVNGDGSRLGARVSPSQLLADPAIAARYPALTEACRQFAGPSIRNRGTVGGNLVNASPAADLVPPLGVYDAQLVLSASSDVRMLPLMAFFVGPGRTVIAPEEILTEVRLPPMPLRTASTFIKLGQRRSMAIAIVNLATRLTLAATGVVSEARIVLGAVAPTPMRASAAEGMLIGETLSDDLLDQTARQAAQEASPITDVRAGKDYRRKMVEVLVRRALSENRDHLGRNTADD